MPAIKKISLVGCSDPLPQREKADVVRLSQLLGSMGVETVVSPHLLSDRIASPAEKAEALNSAFRDPTVDAVCDVSGGDLANTTLPYLDFDAIGGGRAIFFGFSDLTVVINAIIAKTGRPAVNYQIRNLVYADAAAQIAFFKEKLQTLSFSISDLEPRFLRGSELRGRVFGGNIRCFLKLAGTPYWPEMRDGVLLLESLGGGVYQMVTALEQYRQLGVFDQIGGILLGTFTKMQKEKQRPTIEALVLEMTPPHIAVAETAFVGHDPTARPVFIGQIVRIGLHDASAS